MLTRELMLMISRFLFGDFDANDFSFEFPARLNYVYNDFLRENPELCDVLEEDMPEICSYFDPHNTGDPGTYDEKTFREKVSAVYQKAIVYALAAKVS